MKILHLPYCFYPDPVGGTEVYVHELSQELRTLGIESVIAAPAADRCHYLHDGLDVFRYPVSQQVGDVEELYGLGAAEATAAFGALLDQVRPTIVHFHSFTRATSVLTLEQCRARGIPTVLTYHTPTVTCIRGTLLRWGRDICDGELDPVRCSRCVLHSKGLPKALSVVLGSVPPTLSRRMRVRRTGQLWTILGMPYLVSKRIAATRTFLRSVDAIVVPCDWARELLRKNGLPESQLFFSRHGLRFAEQEPGPTAPHGPGPIKFAFVGRAHPTKGLAILIEVFRSSPALRAELTAFLAADPGDPDVAPLLKAAGRDARVRIRDPIWRRDALLRELTQHDCLLVPSLALETGPLVVSEARVVGLPTVGSRLGGLSELIRDGVNGILVEPGSVKAWRSCLERLVADPAILRKLRQGVERPRAMATVAVEMASLYRSLVQ